MTLRLQFVSSSNQTRFKYDLATALANGWGGSDCKMNPGATNLPIFDVSHHSNLPSNCTIHGSLWPSKQCVCLFHLPANGIAMRCRRFMKNTVPLQELAETHNNGPALSGFPQQKSQGLMHLMPCFHAWKCIHLVHLSIKWYHYFRWFGICHDAEDSKALKGLQGTIFQTGMDIMDIT